MSREEKGITLLEYTARVQAFNSALAAYPNYGWSGTKAGWLYLVQSKGKEAPVKIGITRQETPYQRFQQLITTTPHGFDVIGIAYQRNPLRMERVLHRTFKDRAVGGEWFRLTAADIEFIHMTGEFFRSQVALERFLHGRGIKIG